LARTNGIEKEVAGLVLDDESGLSGTAARELTVQTIGGLCASTQSPELARESTAISANYHVLKSATVSQRRFGP
jgi:hypothetical protein